MKENFVTAMEFRHACKVFDEKKKISDSDFSYILNLGRMSPSSFGFEPWKFLIVQDEQLREKLKEFTWGAQGTLPTSSHFVVILARKEKTIRYDSSYVNHIMEDIQKLPKEIVEKKGGLFEKFQKDDFNLLENKRTLHDWATKQTYIALANMMTGAAFIGIDSCPIEGFDIDNITKILEDDFNIDSEEFGISCMVAFGYRKNAQGKKTRQDIDAISQWYV